MLTASPSPSASLDPISSSEHTLALQTLSRLSTEDCAEKPFSGLVICVTGLSKVRLDESLYSVQRSHVNGATPVENFSQAIATSSWQNSCLPAGRDVGSSLCLQPSLRSAPKANGSVKQSSTSVLAGARFYIDPDLSSELQGKVQEAAETWGATCVEFWSKGSNATHVVCEVNSLAKYIGLNINLVSPMWVMSAREGHPLRSVQYSADLARNLADLLITGRNSSRPFPNASNQNGLLVLCKPGNERTGEAQLQDRQARTSAAKAGVRRRRGIRMQPCRTLPRPITPVSLLDTVCWSVTDVPLAAQVYTDALEEAMLENGPEMEACEQGIVCSRNNGRGVESEVSVREICTRPMTESEKQEIIFRGTFLTILFPIDRFSEMGPSSRTFFSEEGFTSEQIIGHIYSFYQEYLPTEEIEVALNTDSKHADRLRSMYASKEAEELGYVPVRRAEFLGSKRHFEGLKRVSQENIGQIYDLWLGS